LWYSPSEIRIEEFLLDVCIDDLFFMIVRMSKDGEVKEVSEDFGYDAKEGCICFDMRGNLVWRVKTRDARKAIKVTNEKRSIILAHNLWGKTEKVRELFGKQNV